MGFTRGLPDFGLESITSPNQIPKRFLVACDAPDQSVFGERGSQDLLTLSFSSCHIELVITAQLSWNGWHLTQIRLGDCV